MANYDTVKNGIALLLKGLGYAESTEVFDFESGSSHEYGKTFILNPFSGNLNEEISETIVDRFYDNQTWQIQIAFDRSVHNDLVQRDQLHRAKDAILKVIDKPANWDSFVRLLKYQAWEVAEFNNYFVLVINLQVIDTYTY